MCTIRDRDLRSAGIDMDLDGEDEDGVDGEEDESVNSNRLSVSPHAPELQLLAVSRQLKKESRLQQHKQYYTDEYRSPIRHFFRGATCF